MTPEPYKTQHALGGPLKSFAVGFCVFSLGSVLAAWLNLHNVHGFLAFVDNILTGIAAGLMVLLYERWRQREVEKKLRTIRLMNHHVRNALQIISAASDSLDRTVPPSTVQDAVRRIEWALREVLPGESEPTDAAGLPNPGTPKKMHRKPILRHWPELLFAISVFGLIYLWWRGQL